MRKHIGIGFNIESISVLVSVQNNQDIGIGLYWLIPVKTPGISIN